MTKLPFPNLQGWQLLQLHKQQMGYAYKGAKRRQLIVLNYGFDVKFAKEWDQAPSFSVTVDVRASNNRENSVGGGAAHDMAERLWPKTIKPYTKWHSMTWPGMPMHYHNNACFWLEKCLGISEWEYKSYDPNPLEMFKQTVHFGEVENDDITFAPIWEQFAPRYSNWPYEVTADLVQSTSQIEWYQSDFTKKLLREQLKELMFDWCRNRILALAHAFVADMVKLGVAIPPDRQLESWVVPLLEAENAPIDSK